MVKSYGSAAVSVMAVTVMVVVLVGRSKERLWVCVVVCVLGDDDDDDESQDGSCSDVWEDGGPIQLREDGEYVQVCVGGFGDGDGGGSDTDVMFCGGGRRKVVKSLW